MCLQMLQLRSLDCYICRNECIPCRMPILPRPRHYPNAIREVLFCTMECGPMYI